MSVPSRPPSLQRALRPGDGEVLRVQRRALPGPGGDVITEVQFDLSSASIPERRFTCNQAWIADEGDQYYLCFGQRKIIGSDLRALVVLHLGPDDVAHFVDACEQIRSTIDQLVSKVRPVPIPLQVAATEPDQCAALTCNIIAVAFSQ